MFENRFQDSEPKLRVVSPRSKPKPKRIFHAALDKSDKPVTALSEQVIAKYFRGPSIEDRRNTQYSILSSLVIVLVSLWIVWPTFVQVLDASKEEEEEDPIIPAGIRSSHRKQAAPQEKPKLKTVKIPALYPKVNNVTLKIESKPRIDVDSYYNNLNTSGSLGDLDLGVGDGLDGPVFLAGQGGLIPEPELLYRVEPEYPEPARRERVDGFVLLEAIVNKIGDVVDVKVLQSPPKRYGFAEKAEEAVTQWRFKPSIYKGKPVNVRIRFAVEFNLLY